MVDHRIKLEGAWNVRELGGYPAGSRRTRRGVFLRGDNVHGLTERDKAELKRLGLTLEADLRSPMEISKKPSALASEPWLRYVNIPLFDGVQSAISQSDIPPSLGEMYRSLLDRGQAEFCALFRLFLENDGLTLFHCTAGKDRTGITAMLLLELCGVEDDVIIRDYAVTQSYLQSQLEARLAELRAMGLTMPDYLFTSKPEDMRETLRYLRAQYGDARSYLASCGLTGEELERLRDKLLDE